MSQFSNRETSGFAQDGLSSITNEIARSLDEQLGPSSFRFSLRSLLLATTAIALLIAGFRTIWVGARASAISNQIANSMRQIELGLNNYASARGFQVSSQSVDDAGVPLSSWRWLITPFATQLDGETMEWDYQASWQSPANRDVREMRFDVYCLDPASTDCNTNIFAIVGDDTAISSSLDKRHRKLPANAMMLMEVADSGKNWMEPGDYNLNDLLAASGPVKNTAKGLLSDRIHVMFADGEVWALSSDTPLEAIHPFLTIAGAKNVDRDELLAVWKVN